MSFGLELVDNSFAADAAPASFEIGSPKGAAQITGFTSGLDDIWLNAAAFKRLGAGSDEGTPLKKGAFVANTSGLATKAGLAQIIYETDTGNLYFDADGKGGKKATLFATVTDGASISASDFLLY